MKTFKKGDVVRKINPNKSVSQFLFEVQAIEIVKVKNLHNGLTYHFTKEQLKMAQPAE